MKYKINIDIKSGDSELRIKSITIALLEFIILQVETWSGVDNKNIKLLSQLYS